MLKGSVLGKIVRRRIQAGRVLRNRVMRRMFTTEREKVREGLAQLQN
jgi:DNA-binding GntR family transcriptional regulator